mmetsp:Transcript_29819/g.46773  ORF Transcript_29819/g.46773 Transcript_29819/m.46773 type:complete len:209 (-) Transcript_29819:347-973(-)
MGGCPTPWDPRPLRISRLPSLRLPSLGDLTGAASAGLRRKATYALPRFLMRPSLLAPPLSWSREAIWRPGLLPGSKARLRVLGVRGAGKIRAEDLKPPYGPNPQVEAFARFSQEVNRNWIKSLTSRVTRPVTSLIKLLPPTQQCLLDFRYCSRVPQKAGDLRSRPSLRTLNPQPRTPNPENLTPTPPTLKPSILNPQNPEETTNPPAR